MLHKAWNSKGEIPYCFPRSSIKFQGHTGQNITDFDPNWVFPDYRPVAAFKSLRFALLYIYIYIAYPVIGISFIKMRWLWDCLICILGVPILVVIQVIWHLYMETASGARLNINTVFARYGDSMLKIRQSQDHLIFNMGIPILVRRHLYIEMAPRFSVLYCSLKSGLTCH